MSEQLKRPAHWSFWLIAAVTLLWNVAGAANFFVQMDPEMVASYRDSERAIITDRPIWATAAFGLAVFGGALGSVLLLLRRSAALYLFVASLLGVVLTMVHAFGAEIDFGAGEIVGIVLMPLAVAAFLIWYANFARRRNWLT